MPFESGEKESTQGELSTRRIAIPSAANLKMSDAADVESPSARETSVENTSRRSGEPHVSYVKGLEYLKDPVDLPVARAIRVVRKVFYKKRGSRDDIARKIQEKFTRKMKNGAWMCKIDEVGSKFFVDIMLPSACIHLRRGNLAIVLLKFEDSLVKKKSWSNYVKFLKQLGLETSEDRTKNSPGNMSFETPESRAA